MTNEVALRCTKSLLSAGFDYFASVPCSLLAPLINHVDELAPDAGASHIPAPREDVAVGLCCGAYFAGRRPVALMQNSGLAQSVNAIASLITPFHFPLLMVISVRGHRGEDTDENLVMGALTEQLLRSLDVRAVMVEPDAVDFAVAAAANWARHGCAALLVSPRTFGVSAL